MRPVSLRTQDKTRSSIRPILTGGRGKSQICTRNQKNLWSRFKNSITQQGVPRVPVFLRAETNLYQKGRAEGWQQVATLIETWQKRVLKTQLDEEVVRTVPCGAPCKKTMKITTQGKYLSKGAEKWYAISTSEDPNLTCNHNNEW